MTKTNLPDDSAGSQADSDSGSALNGQDLDRELGELEQLIEQKKQQVEDWKRRVDQLEQEYAEWGLENSSADNVETEQSDLEETLLSETDIDLSSADEEVDNF